MKRINEMDYTETRELAKLFQNWLGCYTQEVINKVMEKREEIIANELAMNLIKELYGRKEEETNDEINSFAFMLMNYEDSKQYDIHNHCLTHAQSYRDVLYDMYIK